MPTIDFNEDPLKWWKENEKDFKELSNVAKKFLSAPLTSA